MAGLDRRMLATLARRNLFRFEQRRACLIVVCLAGLAGWLWAGLLGADRWWVSVAAAVAVPVSAWLAMPAVQRLVLSQWVWVVGFFDSSATLLVHPDGGCWVLSDHMAVRPGTGAAGAFRRMVFAHLAAEADRLGVPIVMSTRSWKLAGLYVRDMPGLRIVTVRQGSGALLFGREFQLRRSPVEA